MTHALIVHHTTPDPDYVHAQQAAGLLRVSLVPTRGRFAALGLVQEPRSQSFAVSGVPPCPHGLPVPCDVYELINILGSRLSVTRPMAFVVFALLRLEYGKQRAWAEEVVRVSADLGGTFLAAAHLVGRGEHNAIVEITADKAGDVFQTLLAVTDLDGVQQVDSLLIRPDDQRGMGDMADEVD